MSLFAARRSDALLGSRAEIKHKSAQKTSKKTTVLMSGGLICQRLVLSLIETRIVVQQMVSNL